MTQDFLQKVLASPQLPSLPTIALKVIDLAQDPDADFEEIAGVLQHDPALSSKILATVNSAFYGRRREVGTISAALKILGLNSVKTLALGFSLVDNLKGSCDQDLDHVAYWRRSLYTATAARSFSRATGLVQHEEVFLGGLLQDIGMIALSQAVGDQYARVLEAAGPCHSQLGACERAMLGFDHSQVGAELVESWGLPPILVEPIRLHEKPHLAGGELRAVVRAVALGNRVAEVFLSEDGDGGALDDYYTQAQEWFDLAHADAEGQLKNVHATTQETGRLFELPTGNLGNPDEILARANDALTQLKSEDGDGAGAKTDDPPLDELTGLSPRPALDRFLADRFAEARGSKPTSVLLLDVDRVAQRNEEFGRDMGDRMLQVFAQTLERVGEASGAVFRYDGDAFAVVCPATSTADALQVARDINSAVQATAVVLTAYGEEIRITASIGIATHDGTAYEDVGQLLAAAEQALGSAKTEDIKRIQTAVGTSVSDAA